MEGRDEPNFIIILKSIDRSQLCSNGAVVDDAPACASREGVAKATRGGAAWVELGAELAPRRGD